MVHWNIESYGRVFSFPPPSGLMKKAWAMQWDKDGRYVKVFGGSSLTYSRFGQPPPFPSTWIEMIIVCNCTVQHLFDANVQLQLVCTKTSFRQGANLIIWKKKNAIPLLFSTHRLHPVRHALDRTLFRTWRCYVVGNVHADWKATEMP